MPESPESAAPRVEVGRYTRLADARERGLVASAKDLPHWIEREDDEWVLFVEEPVRDEIRAELAAFESEQRRSSREPELRPSGKSAKTSLFLAAWLLGGFFWAQQMTLGVLEQRGNADSAAILSGEWWRTITALTLHADGPHLAANLATGLLFASFLIPRFGGGATWLAILLSGALGNALNAWGYRGEPHLSLGASTACFGALGILVGTELIARWRAPETRSRWQLILPIGAGLALLAFLGVGEETRNVDYMAHCWGLIAGLGEGVLAQSLGLGGRLAVRGQRWAGWVTLAVIAGAWLRANS